LAPIETAGSKVAKRQAGHHASELAAQPPVSAFA
jgi:hypothetical protein